MSIATKVSENDGDVLYRIDTGLNRCGFKQ